MSGLPIPDVALRTHISILGKTGSGKSNAAKVIVELLLARDERVCVVDPTGTWWGMRLDPKGKKPSPFKPVIFGGNHADLPLAPEHGATIAQAIGTSSGSAIIDVRLMSTAGRTRFFTSFADELLRSNRGPLHLIIDEAHNFAPQGKVMDPQSGMMLAAANKLVSEGRGIGLRIILITQRPQKLHKDSLTQVETLVATLHYVDPPYLPETRARGNRYDLAWRMYRHELSREDHADLLAFLAELDGMVVLSSYPDPLYDAALPGWRRVETVARADGARERVEVLWLNPACVDALDRQDHRHRGGAGLPMFAVAP